MKILALPAVATALSLFMVASGPAIAKTPYCSQKRTVAVGKDSIKVKAMNECQFALKAKGEALYGPNYAKFVDIKGACQKLGSENGGDYWQCICSARMCRWISLESYTPPGPLKPKFERQPGRSGVPDRLFRMPRSLSSPMRRR